MLGWCLVTIAAILLLKPLFPQSRDLYLGRWLPKMMNDFLSPHSLHRIIRHLILGLVLGIMQMAVLWRRFRYAWMWSILTLIGWFFAWNWLLPSLTTWRPFGLLVPFNSTWSNDLVRLGLPLFPYSLVIGIIQSFVGFMGNLFS